MFVCHRTITSRECSYCISTFASVSFINYSNFPTESNNRRLFRHTTITTTLTTPHHTKTKCEFNKMKIFHHFSVLYSIPLAHSRSIYAISVCMMFLSHYASRITKEDEHRKREERRERIGIERNRNPTSIFILQTVVLLIAQ